MKEIITENQILVGIEQIDWLIDNTNENVSNLLNDKSELEHFHENWYGKSANENINGGKHVNPQISNKEYILMNAKLKNIDAKYNQYRNSSNTKNL